MTFPQRYARPTEELRGIPGMVLAGHCLGNLLNWRCEAVWHALTISCNGR
jgi:hypothetical protein